MISFILNESLIKTENPSEVLLDFIRKKNKGTKIGCREGDCGACTVLIGSLEGNNVSYHSATSCITPILNVHGKHVITIEGLRTNGIVQLKMLENNASQCGFCTPGFIMSMTGSIINNQSILGELDGNICRCTGYTTIIKTAIQLENMDINPSELFSDYFNQIPKRLSEISALSQNSKNNDIVVGGGTDLYVQRAHELYNRSITKIESSEISMNNGIFRVGASTTFSQFFNDPIISKFIVADKYRLIASTPIRNIATIAGNIVNASPIGDMSILLLALNASVITNKKNILLRDFFLDYKKIQLLNDEHIIRFDFKIPNKFNFEKVSKRMHLDIASVNTAISFKLENNILSDVHLSAGGVFATPLYLQNTVNYLNGKQLNAKIVNEASKIATEEISPISDIRGSKEYKTLLLRNLLFAHFSNYIKIEEILV